MFCKVLRHVLVPSSGLDENNIKGAFYPGAPLAPLHPITLYMSCVPIQRLHPSKAAFKTEGVTVVTPNSKVPSNVASNASFIFQPMKETTGGLFAAQSFYKLI